MVRHNGDIPVPRDSMELNGRNVLSSSRTKSSSSILVRWEWGSNFTPTWDKYEGLCFSFFCPLHCCHDSCGRGNASSGGADSGPRTGTIASLGLYPLSEVLSSVLELCNVNCGHPCLQHNVVSEKPILPGSFLSRLEKKK